MSSPTHLVGLQCVALWDYDALDDDELSFRKGDTITIVEVDDGFFRGTLGSDSGWFQVGGARFPCRIRAHTELHTHLSRTLSFKLSPDIYIYPCLSLSLSLLYVCLSLCAVCSHSLLCVHWCRMTL
jgi:SH3 domain